MSTEKLGEKYDTFSISYKKIEGKSKGCREQGLRLKSREHDGSNNNLVAQDARLKRQKAPGGVRDDAGGSRLLCPSQAAAAGAVSDLGRGARAGGPGGIGHSLLQQVQAGRHGREGGLGSHRERRRRTLHLRGDSSNISTGFHPQSSCARQGLSSSTGDTLLCEWQLFSRNGGAPSTAALGAVQALLWDTPEMHSQKHKPSCSDGVTNLPQWALSMEKQLFNTRGHDLLQSLLSLCKLPSLQSTKPSIFVPGKLFILFIFHLTKQNSACSPLHFLFFTIKASAF